MPRFRSLKQSVAAILTAGGILAGVVVAVAPAVAAGSAVVVTTTADSGAGSLREAIIAVNADPTAVVGSPATITFAIPGAGVQTIAVSTALPAITRPVIVDGLSQPGATCGSAGSPRNLLISLRGQGNAVSMSGLVLSGGDSTIQGLAVSYFRRGNIISTGSTGGDRIRCNHLGTRADGRTLDTIASNGVTMTGNPVVTASLDVGSPNTVIGGRARTPGVCDGDCNVVVGEASNNNQIGLFLRFGAVGTTSFNALLSSSTAAGGSAQGNFFGILQDGTTPPGAFRTSRIIFGLSADAASAPAPAVPQPVPSSGGYLIGGLLASGDLDPLAANVVSAAKFRDGLDCDTGFGCGSGLRIWGNYIGAGPTGVESVDANGRRFGNARDGIQAESMQAVDIQGNVVSGNGANGVNLSLLSNNSLVKNNRIGANADGTANGNGWYSTALTAGDPTFGIAAPTTGTSAAAGGNGISIGTTGAAVPNRDVANLILEDNLVVNNARAGMIAVGGTGNTTIRRNTIGQLGAGNGTAGVIMMTDNNTISSNTISHNGGPGITILRNTNPLMGTVFGTYTPNSTSASANLITANSIFANSGVGIDLNSINSTWNASGNALLFPYGWTAGVTANDGALSVAPPTNSGAFGNRDQDYPVITDARVHVAAGTLTVSGHVGLASGSSSFAGSTVEVFQGHNAPADQNGEVYLSDGASVVHPEGQTLLGSCIVDGVGQFSGCVFSVSAPSLLSNPILTATATLGQATSEFGPIYNAQVIGSVSGRVFVDGTNTPLVGVAITLTDGSGATRNTVTDSSGDYQFSGLPMGNYTLTETQPVGYGNGAVEPDNTIAVTLAPATPDVVGNDFSEGAASISGRVFVDGTNLSLVGVTLELLDNTNTVIATTHTVADGSYSFTGLIAGDYEIREIQPVTYGPGVVTPGNLIAVTLAAGGSSTGNDFSEGTASITGRVFVDGTLAPLAGVVITLLDSAGATVKSTMTVADGSYSFAGLPLGNYTIVETQPTGYLAGAVTPGNNIPVALTIAGSFGNDFSETGASLSGTVYVDGTLTPLGGVTVTLLDSSGQPVASASTAADGTYLFAGLAAGTYTVIETQPAGLMPGVIEPDNSSSVALPAGATSVGNDFSETGASISGTVYVDGTLTPIAGVTITLTDSRGNRLVVVTGADGQYSFTGLLLGDYTIIQTQPDGWRPGQVVPGNTIVLTLTSSSGRNDFSEAAVAEPPVPTTTAPTTTPSSSSTPESATPESSAPSGTPANAVRANGSESSGDDRQLAFTGGSIGQLLGLAMALLGIGLCLAKRRRSLPR